MGRLGKECEVHGVKFSNNKCACEYFGVSNSNVCNIMKNKKVELGDAIDWLLEKKKNFVVHGVEYKHMKDMCEKMNLSYAAAYRLHYKYGMKCEEIVGNINKPRVNVDIHEEGINNIMQVADYYNIRYSVLLKLIRRGISVEEAIKMNIKKKEYDKVEVSGTVFSSLQEACKKLDISYKTACSMISREYKNISMDCKIYEGLKEICLACDIKYTTLYFNVRRGGVQNIKDIALMIKHRKLKSHKISAGLFICSCAECGKKICLTENEILYFKHDEVICKEREWLEVEENGRLCN